MALQPQLDRYFRGLDFAKTPTELERLLDSFEPGWVGEGAYKVLTNIDFADWSAGLARERTGEENSDEWYEKYIDLLVPAPMVAMKDIAEGVWDDTGI